MRTLAELIHPDETGADEVRRLLAHAVNPVEVIRGERGRGERALLRLQQESGTPLGALALRLGGLVFDYGWLRLLGGGSPRYPRDLTGWNGPAASPRLPGALLVADDVVGGFFAVDDGAFGGPRGGVRYFAPDTLVWEDMEIDYRGLLEWACNGDLDAFYEESRWPGWEAEVLGVRADQGLALEPPLSMESTSRLRTRVSLESLWARTTAARA